MTPSDAAAILAGTPRSVWDEVVVHLHRGDPRPYLPVIDRSLTRCRGLARQLEEGIGDRAAVVRKLRAKVIKNCRRAAALRVFGPHEVIGTVEALLAYYRSLPEAKPMPWERP
jgi:hypothetical protein